MKKRKKKAIILILIIALILLIPTTTFAVLAIASSSVSYDNSATGLPNTVQGAIDRLYYSAIPVYKSRRSGQPL